MAPALGGTRISITRRELEMLCTRIRRQLLIEPQEP